MPLTLIQGGGDHAAEIRPDPATVRSERTGQPASVLDGAAYPLTATCAACAAPIRLAHLFADWQH